MHIIKENYSILLVIANCTVQRWDASTLLFYNKKFVFTSEDYFYVGISQR